MDRQKHLEILNNKLEALLNIWDFTKSLEFTGAGTEERLEREAEDFAALYELRSKIFAKIENMDKLLAGYGDSDDPAVKQVTGKIRETAKAIAEFDKKNIRAGKKLEDFLKGNLKRIRDGRGMNNAYVDPYEATSGYYFDSLK